MRLTKPLRIIPGGSSASKTFGILALLIDHAIRNKDCHRLQKDPQMDKEMEGGAVQQDNSHIQFHKWINDLIFLS